MSSAIEAVEIVARNPDAKRLIDQLRANGMPIIHASWRAPEPEGPVGFCITTPWVDSEGTLPVYERISAAMRALPGCRLTLSDIVALGEDGRTWHGMPESVVFPFRPEQPARELPVYVRTGTVYRADDFHFTITDDDCYGPDGADNGEPPFGQIMALLRKRRVRITIEVLG